MSATTAFVRAFLDTASRDHVGPLLLGISGPQGCGKSTLARELTAAWQSEGKRAVTLSIDDVYLTREEQVALTAQHPGLAYYAFRGYPGTHDVELGSSTLDALTRLGPGAPMALPRYDKSAFDGKGDRAPHQTWPVVEGPLDLIVLEGWCLGFRPIAEELALHAGLSVPNAALARHAAWHAKLQAFVHLDAASPEFVIQWRVQAEAERRAAGLGALSAAEAEAYVRAFLPAYAAWVPGLRAHSPIAGSCFRVEIGEDRAPNTCA